MARYFPTVFETASLDAAKAIILTPEGPGADTDARWAGEAPYVLELIANAITVRPDMLVVDYGCGVGRISRALIAATGCAVIGVDISPAMRRMADEYVASERFVAVSPEEFDLLTNAGLRADAALSIWVLQHCFAPGDDIARMKRALRPDGQAFVLNMPRRAIPAIHDGMSETEGFHWHHDDVDVATLLRQAFRVESEGIPDRTRTPSVGEIGAFWMGLRALPD